MDILSIDKKILKDTFYLVEQADCWLVWHGTIEGLKDSILGGQRILEYTLTGEIPKQLNHKEE